MSNRTMGVQKQYFDFNCMPILSFSVLQSNIKIKKATSKSRLNKGKNKKTPLSFELGGFGFQWCLHMVWVKGLEPPTS